MGKKRRKEKFWEKGPPKAPPRDYPDQPPGLLKIRQTAPRNRIYPRLGQESTKGGEKRVRTPIPFRGAPSQKKEKNSPGPGRENPTRKKFKNPNSTPPSRPQKPGGPGQGRRTLKVARPGLQLGFGGFGGVKAQKRGQKGLTGPPPTTGVRMSFGGPGGNPRGGPDGRQLKRHRLSLIHSIPFPFCSPSFPCIFWY